MYGKWHSHESLIRRLRTVEKHLPIKVKVKVSPEKSDIAAIGELTVHAR